MKSKYFCIVIGIFLLIMWTSKKNEQKLTFFDRKTTKYHSMLFKHRFKGNHCESDLALKGGVT